MIHALFRELLTGGFMQKFTIFILAIMFLVSCQERSTTLFSTGISYKVNALVDGNGALEDFELGDVQVMDDEQGSSESIEVSEPIVQDQIGDELANEIEHDESMINCLVVKSFGVSSATVSINSKTVLSQSDFSNKDVVFAKIDVSGGENVLSVTLTGEPGDKLVLAFYNCTEEPAVLIKELVFERTSGKP